MARYPWIPILFILQYVAVAVGDDHLGENTDGYQSPVNCYNSSDKLCIALNESYNYEYDCLYGNAFVHLDMEDVALVNAAIMEDGNDLNITAVSDNCSYIMQVHGNDTIPGFGSAMSITSSSDNQSYVIIDGIGDFADGLTASLWIKHDQLENDCTVLHIGNSANYLKLKKSPIIDTENFSYIIEHNHDNVVSFPASHSWDWNMISVTLMNDDIFMFDNGELVSNNTISVSVPLKANILLNGNGTDGCNKLVVDDLAVWKRPLNMSELIALRVQPFDANNTNDTCKPDDHFNPEESLNLIDTASPQDASMEAISFYTYVDSVDKFAKKDVTDMNKFLDSVEGRGFLTDDSVDDKTKKSMRNAYAEVANSLIKLSNEDEELAPNIDQFYVMTKIESMTAACYLDSDSDTIPDENITMEYVKIIYASYDLKVDENLNYQTDKALITIPGSLFQKGERAKITVCVYDLKLSSDFNNLIDNPNKEDISVASNIISIQINSDNPKFSKPIILGFTVDTSKRDANTKYTPTCSYLAGIKWSTEGVTTKATGDGKVICELDHLTNFAVLMAVRPIEISEAHQAILSALTYILITISIICLILSFIILFCLRELDNTQRIQILKNFVAALLFAQLLFTLGTPLFKGITSMCVFVAVVSHYMWLAVFTWMLVQGIQLYTKVRLLAGGNIKQLFYVLFAWGFPLPLCLIPLIFLKDEYIAQNICWIPPAAVYFFVVPAMLVFVINLVVAIMVMNTFLTVKVNKDKSHTEKLKSSLRAVVVMVPILGLTWVFGFLVLFAQDVLLFNYMFVILNPLQGVFVFLFHFVLNEDVRSAVLRRRNKVAASAENTIFTKLPRKGEQSDGDTITTKAPLPSDSNTNM